MPFFNDTKWIFDVPNATSVYAWTPAEDIMVNLLMTIAILLGILTVIKLYQFFGGDL